MKKDIHICQYHVVWTPKYRKAYLRGSIKNLVQSSIQEKALELDVKIVKFQVMPDHVHLFIKIPPNLSLANIIRQMKGYSSFVVRRNLVLHKYKAFWGHGYFCESIGHISEQTIERYIDEQWVHYDNLKCLSSPRSNSSPH